MGGCGWDYRVVLAGYVLIVCAERLFRYVRMCSLLGYLVRLMLWFWCEYYVSCGFVKGLIVGS